MASGKGLDIGLNVIKIYRTFLSFLSSGFFASRKLPALFRFSVVLLFLPTAFHFIRVGFWVIIQN